MISDIVKNEVMPIVDSVQMWITFGITYFLGTIVYEKVVSGRCLWL